MSDQPSVPRFDLDAPAFHDLTLSFDTFFRDAPQGVARLSGRRFLRCNLAGPTLVALGPGNRFADCIFSACAFTVADHAPVAGAILLEDCVLDDCVLTRWSVFLPPPQATALLQDMPQARVFGLPFGWG